MFRPTYLQEWCPLANAVWMNPFRIHNSANRYVETLCEWQQKWAKTLGSSTGERENEREIHPLALSMCDSIVKYNQGHRWNKPSQTSRCTRLSLASEGPQCHGNRIQCRMLWHPLNGTDSRDDEREKRMSITVRSSSWNVTATKIDWLSLNRKF